MTEIDFARLAEPQDDGYDTAIILALAEGAPPTSGTAVTMFGGRTVVTARPEGMPAPFTPAPLNHPNLVRAEAILAAAWPVAHRQCADLLREVNPFIDPRLTPAQWRINHGSSSNGFGLPFGVVTATVDNAFGLAQALVHELAHHKLRALGMNRGSAHRLVLNDPSELFESPIVRDQRRPMTAVVHAQYSFMHVTALDVAMCGAADEETRRAGRYLLARNVPRMERGRQEIAAHLRTDRAGDGFFAAFDRWSEATLQHGNRILAAHGFGRARLDGSRPPISAR